jgi:pectate lyase
LRSETLAQAASCEARPCHGNNPLPAFPGAEGFAALITGGRCGRVLRVTSLAASGKGSLKDALDARGPRIIVFAVSGVIRGDIEIPHGNVTIAGQTAPGAGITIEGGIFNRRDETISNVIIRHIRVRVPPDCRTNPEACDAIRLSPGNRILLDHVSASFAIDETLDLFETEEVTVQSSSFTFSATRGHPDGAHNFGLLSGPDGGRISVHRNLFAHHKYRNPAIATGPAEVVNNVVYNARTGFTHHNAARGLFEIIGNVFKKGPNYPLDPFYIDDEDEFANKPRYYIAGNLPPAEPLPPLPPALRAKQPFGFKRDAEHACYLPVTAMPARQAESQVLQKAGAFPRDEVDQRAVADARNGTGQIGAFSVPNLLRGLSATVAPKDSDEDGLPDSWELQNGLNPNDDEDNQKRMPSGYPAIEDYINDL